MILFIDDNIERHLVFAARNKGKDVYQTASMFEAFTEISQCYVDELWLDHDLGYALNREQREFQTSGNDLDVVDIMPLVRWLCGPDCPLAKSTRVVVHSWNTPAAYLMSMDLRKAGYTNVIVEPFKHE